MKKSKVLPHIADFRLKAQGDTIEQLFYAALEGMNAVIKGEREISKKIDSGKRIIIDSVDTSALLIDFLSEALTLTHNNKHLYYILGIEKLNENHIDCYLAGHEINGFDEDIKAVTYTEANIIRTEDNHFETIIVFDI
jgi:SHS2 domain-containing protein